jgi:hypothetical protein
MATMNNVIYSRTVSYPDKETSPRLTAWIGLTEETNGYGLFEEIRRDGEMEETKLVCWHFEWDRAGAIEHALEYIRNKQQTCALAKI